ncbi:MAG TPA: hypothetical protein VND41_00360 [Nitrososphaerales archaeon]|nr:hypothetical protein [Nitrososphaerales archaeon]
MVRGINFADRVKPMTLNMGSIPTLAFDLGFMSKEGLSVKVVECDGSPQALAALERGDAELAQVNISPVIAEVARGRQAQGSVGQHQREPAEGGAAKSWRGRSDVGVLPLPVEDR